ncbi:hypothetical protein RTE01_46940 [Raoultella terrigena]|nr:hypothetical protein RTE01_46940 [Raoultella terrigena]
MVGFKPVTGGCLYGYDPHSRTPVTCCSFQRYYGFHRTRWSLRNFAETLIESNDPALKMALCGGINACLTLLQPTLLEPVPPHLVASLTVDTLPASSPRFDPECTELCR